MAKPLKAARSRSVGHLKYAIVGGRLEDDNIAIYAEMHRLSGGRILVFSTASSEPEEVGKETAAVFRSHGFDVDIAPLTAANAQTVARDAQLLDRIADYRSVYFTGGDQANIFNALSPNSVETPALKAIRAAHKAGGLLAGSSAGAAMMSHPMLLGGTSHEAMVHGVTDDPKQPGILLGEGLGFFNAGLVDQHFIKRGRLGRLVVAMNATGHRRAFGIDENTALIVEDGVGTVCGEYGVFYVNTPLRADHARDDHGARAFKLSYLDDGDAIDLKSFAIKPGAEKRRLRKSEMIYRAPAHSRRNAFGGYAIYDLMARLVLGDQSSYSSDTSE
ncbi:MAG: cyanophycinase, partial [Pseudomonadota bacterium]